MKCLLTVLVIFSLLGCGNMATKSNDDIIAEEEANNFKKLVEQLESKLKETGKYSVKPAERFENVFLIDKLEAKKAFIVRDFSTMISVNIRCYNYSEFDGSTIVKKNYFYRIKKFKERGIEKGLFAIFNNYTVVTLDYACNKDKKNNLAFDIIPIVYSIFKLPDSRILNLECGNFIKDDTELY